jgi:hypothetical protein
MTRRANPIYNAHGLTCFKVIFLTILFIFLIFSSSTLIAAPVNGAGELIADPSISKKCKGLIEKREQKLKFKQKLSALIEKNRYLQKRTPQNKKTLLNKLISSFNRLQRELYLSRLRIQKMTEDIIRQGCPNVTLE